MPWSVKDVDEHKKGLSAEQKTRWVSIANAILKDCMETKKDEAACAVSAIRIANSKVK